MVSGGGSTEGGEVLLEDFLRPLVRNWWLVVGALVVSLAAAYLTLPESPPQAFESQTKILLIAPLSERINSERGGVGLLALGDAVSPDFLKALATAEGLLNQIIDEQDLRHPDTGQTLSGNELLMKLGLQIEKSGDLPLLTMTATAPDPKQAKAIVGSWARFFVADNSRLFETEVDRSYDFHLEQYQEAEKALKGVEDGRAGYLQNNPLTTVESRIQALTDAYQDSISRQQRGTGLLADNRARLRQIEESLAEEPELVTQDQSISKEALIVLLSDALGGEDMTSYSDLIFTAEVPNSLRFSLKETAVLLRSEIAALESDVQYSAQQVQVLEAEIVSLSSELSAFDTEINRYDRQIEILSDNTSQLAISLRESQTAKAERAGAFLEVQPPVESKDPVETPDTAVGRLVIGGVLGLIVGVLAAFAWDWVRRGNRQSN